MKLYFEVERRRGSVTQGEAAVLLNGQEVVTFGDKIELCPKGTRRGAEYGENIDGWQSVKSDADFLRGVLFPFYLNEKRIKDRIAEILNREDKITELTDYGYTREQAEKGFDKCREWWDEEHSRNLSTPYILNTIDD